MSPFCSDFLLLLVRILVPPGPQAYKFASPLDSCLPLPCCHIKSLAKSKVSSVLPFFPMATATNLIQAFSIFMKFLCPNRFIFLTIKLMPSRQPRITISKIKGSVPLNNHSSYFGMFSSVPFLCMPIFPFK